MVKLGRNAIVARAVGSSPPSVFVASVAGVTGWSRLVIARMDQWPRGIVAVSLAVTLTLA